MFYALAHLEEKFFVNNLYKFIALAPCILFSQGDVPETYYYESIYKFPEIGIYNLYGPNW